MKNFYLLLAILLIVVTLSVSVSAGIIHQPGRADGPSCDEVREGDLCFRDEEETTGTSQSEHDVYVFDSGASEWVFIP